MTVFCTYSVLLCYDHMQAVSAKYLGRAVDELKIQIEFDENEIELGISSELEGTTCNGWRITVPYYPRVSAYLR